MHYDQRGRVDTERLTISANGGSLNFPTFPQYQEALNYNDANQLTTTQTTVGGQNGYTFTQVYDGNTGAQTGLSNNSVGVANLATLSYNGQGLVSGINYFSSTGAALASSTLSYDGDQRATGTNATWQNGNTIYGENLAYDAVGNVVSRSTTMGAVPGVNNSGGTETQNFCYDEQDRLVWAGKRVRFLQPIMEVVAVPRSSRRLGVAIRRAMSTRIWDNYGKGHSMERARRSSISTVIVGSRIR